MEAKGEGEEMRKLTWSSHESSGDTSGGEDASEKHQNVLKLALTKVGADRIHRFDGWVNRQEQ